MIAHVIVRGYTTLFFVLLHLKNIKLELLNKKSSRQHFLSYQDSLRIGGDRMLCYNLRISAALDRPLFFRNLSVNNKNAYTRVHDSYVYLSCAFTVSNATWS